MRKNTGLLLIILLLIYVTIALFPRFPNHKGSNPLRRTSELPLLIAHGGGNKEFPDNTLEAFYHAYSIDPGMMLETDVSLTKDGVIILSHDTTLDRKTNLVQASIYDIEYQTLVDQEVDFSYHNPVTPSSNGYNVTATFVRYQNYLGEAVSPLDVDYPEGVHPRHDSKFLVTTLEDLIQAFPDNKINVEIKQSGSIGLEALAAVIDLMERTDENYQTFSRMVLASFHKEIFSELLRIKKEDHPELMLSPATKGVIKYYALHVLGLDLFYFDTVTVLQVPPVEMGLHLDTKGFIETAHRHNIAVHYWTIDDPETMRLLIKNGADGIMTNIPSLLKSVMDAIETDSE
ncbi:MAG: glycerophosphodiester phosphodiesterase family protein [Candidatus Izemoplasmatales bacterium]